MGLEYENRRGDTYRLLRGRTPTGKDRFYLAKRKRAQGEPADTIPAGFEIREDPESGVVVLRRIREATTTDEEFALVETALHDRGDLRHFIVDAEESHLGVYVTHHDLFPNSRDLFEGILGIGAASRVDLLKHVSMDAALRFALVDEEQRTFEFRRPDDRGIHRTWPTFDVGSLGDLVNRWIPRIGSDDFFIRW